MGYIETPPLPCGWRFIEKKRDTSASNCISYFASSSSLERLLFPITQTLFSALLGDLRSTRQVRPSNFYPSLPSCRHNHHHPLVPAFRRSCFFFLGCSCLPGLPLPHHDRVSAVTCAAFAFLPCSGKNSLLPNRHFVTFNSALPFLTTTQNLNCCNNPQF